MFCKCPGCGSEVASRFEFVQHMLLARDRCNLAVRTVRRSSLSIVQEVTVHCICGWSETRDLPELYAEWQLAVTMLYDHWHAHDLDHHLAKCRFAIAAGRKPLGAI